jgi:hypothetical protein
VADLGEGVSVMEPDEIGQLDVEPGITLHRTPSRRTPPRFQ